MSDPLILIDPGNEPQITMEPTLEDRIQMLEIIKFKQAVA